MSETYKACQTIRIVDVVWDFSQCNICPCSPPNAGARYEATACSDEELTPEAAKTGLENIVKRGYCSPMKNDSRYCEWFGEVKVEKRSYNIWDHLQNIYNKIFPPEYYGD